ncbi:MAG: type II toxin-antitoxin system VapC family toxin [Acidobacteria bacterium]|nr:type II toxin-antitoxin system VapC family toxin [Acidobacteriota bacterium]MCY3965064.1 type II toxin-antitoxin system VapC family toxin [Acidobacteriota bacterium]
MNAPVLDCSVACAWLLEDERVPGADRVLGQAGTHGASAPGLFWAELRNALVMAERRGRLTPTQTTEALTEIEHLDVELDHAPDEETTLRLARDHRLSVYDALYLELAIRQKRELATLDTALQRAAESEGVAVCR